MRVRLPGRPPSEEIIREIRSRQSATLLAFSAGKDSVAAWLAIRPHFDRVVPLYRYGIPGLEFVEETLTYYEKFFGEKIIQLPHPGLYQQLRNLVFQPPERCAMIEARRSKLFYDYETSRREAAADTGLPIDTYIASGVRASDSGVRRMHFTRHGAITESSRTYYPVWDFAKDDVIEIMQRASVKVPIDYRIFGRSVDGIGYAYLAPIKKHFPRDYQRILEIFPLADLELFRFEQMESKA